MIIPLGKLKSLTTAFFSSSESEADFIDPATPITAMPINVITTPTMTDAVNLESASSSGKKRLSNTGAMMVPRPAQVPKAILCPNATPR